MATPYLIFLFNAVAAEQRQGPFADCASWSTVQSLRVALRQAGYALYLVNLKSPRQLEDLLTRLPRPELAFVIAEGFLEEPASLYDGRGPACIRQILQYYGVPFTHSSPAGMKRCRYKHLTYRVLAHYGLPVPPHHLVLPAQPDWPRHLAEAIRGMEFPLFVKPNGGGNSIGISEASIVHAMHELIARIEELVQELGPQPVLVESYLPGREYTVGILGNQSPFVLPVLAFPPGCKVRDTERKKQECKERENMEILLSNSPRYPAFYRLARAAFAALGASDVLRLDLREDAAGNLQIIDANGTPSLAATASLPYLAADMGLSQANLVHFLLHAALQRHGLTPTSRLAALATEALEILTPYGVEVA